MLQLILISMGSIFMVPFLALGGVAFKLVGVLFPLITLLEVFTGTFTTFLNGFLATPFDFSFTLLQWEVPAWLQIPMALLFGWGLILLGRQFWVWLGDYLDLLRSVYSIIQSS